MTLFKLNTTWNFRVVKIIKPVTGVFFFFVYSEKHANHSQCLWDNIQLGRMILHCLLCITNCY